ncbi:hypothetical protein K523DRAFT_20646 [Schizophyllum commune Tattone D]|nr:hypothetical protein K523DRAFT_20646 [Schizophyllum commune Tattone D]
MQALAPTDRPAEAPPRRPAVPISSRRANSKDLKLSLGMFSPSADTITTSPTRNARGQHRFTANGFLPMPPIRASPVCTPTTSADACTFDSLSQVTSSSNSSLSASQLTTAPTSPQSPRCKPALLAPTWIAVPPTPPPPTLVKRSVTCVTSRHRKHAAVSVSPSMPNTAPRRHPHRSVSAPSLSMRRKSMSDTLYRAPALREYDLNATGSKLRPGISRKVREPQPPLASHIHALNTPHTSRPSLFHIEGSTPSDADEDELDNAGEPGPSKFTFPERVITAEPDAMDPDGEEAKWRAERLKEDTRKYHALMELLTTEVGYVLDMRALVTIYLRNLANLTSRPSFSRSGSSFTSISRVNSANSIHNALALTTVDGQGVQHLSPTSGKEKDKGRVILNAVEMDIMMRNAEDIMQLHEEFIDELREALLPHGIRMGVVRSEEGWPELNDQSDCDIDSAIGVVATKFAVESSRFNMYEAFCTGHQEATEVIRRVQHQHPPEWDEFERRCSDMVHEMSPRPSAEEPQATPRKAPPHAASASAATPTNADTITADLPSPSPRKRSRSVHSLDGAVRSLRRRSVAQQREALPFPNELRARRLTLMDYLIKPIQRICKYPLLLDQLKPSRGAQRLSAGQPSRRSAVHVAVESAAQAMRHVAAAVDAARARQAVCAQSALIVSRVASALRLSSSSSASQHSLPASLNMTSSFLSSLGTCLLAGSLDVVHHSPLQPMTASANIKAKYLGAFLYLGGYLILVKVCKGKVYEPKHWFSLADFEIVDLDERDAMLPCSFRLLGKGHQFELAAACQREKEAWMASMREAKAHRTSWINEPTSSLYLDARGGPIQQSESAEVLQSITPLPTIQSIPELRGSSSSKTLEESLMAVVERSDGQQGFTEVSRRLHDGPPQHIAASRRSSTASVKAIFSSADNETVVIRRASHNARLAVDRGLLDVISEPVLAARAQASRREEDLFQAPSVAGSRAMPRANSGLSIANAKSKLTRHESVRVYKRNSIFDVEAASADRTRGLSLANRRLVKRPSVISTEGVSAFGPPSASSSPSPSPFSHFSQSSARSSSSSPVNLTSSSSHKGLRHVPSDPESKRRSSLVRNFKGFLRGASSSFSSANSSTRTLAIPETQSDHGHGASLHDMNRTVTQSLLRRFSKTAVRTTPRQPLQHRRANSAPDRPDEPGGMEKPAEQQDPPIILDVHIPDVTPYFPSLAPTATHELDFTPVSPHCSPPAIATAAVPS